MAVNGRPGPVMVVWGPDFAGLSLDEIADQGDGPAPCNAPGALAALAAWVRARAALPLEGRPLPWPGAALVDEKAETVLFLPEAAVRRVFDAGGAGVWINKAERWSHPDYSGEEADVFTAAALLYRALSGSPPYPCRDRDVLREDIREGVFTPPRLAAPGISAEAAALITAALSPRAKLRTGRPLLADFARLFAAEAAGGVAGSAAGTAGFFRDIGREERLALEAERKRFLQKREKTVKAKRFLSRNRTAILAVLGAVLAAALVAGSVIRARLDGPSTRGMDAAAVVESYYRAITAMDHETAAACVTGGAGKDDINMITSLYVVSKVRQAYEAQTAFISPEEWRESGGGVSAKAVFGIDGLRLEGIDTDESDGRLGYRAKYLFFNPYPESGGNTAAPDAENKAPLPLPAGIPCSDELALEKDKKGLWHIAEIRRAYGLN
jgi:outer membrane murein-binding lipoprotein Lpp